MEVDWGGDCHKPDSRTIRTRRLAVYPTLGVTTLHESRRLALVDVQQVKKAFSKESVGGYHADPEMNY